MYWLRSSVGSDLLSLTANRSRSARCGRAGRGPFGPTSRLSRSGGEESREDHGQVSIIMSVLFYAIRPCNDLDTIVANGRKQTVLHLFLDAALKTVAYLRVSTRSQDLANQKLAILEFSQKRRFPIDQFIESRISSRQSPLERRIDEMLGTLEPGDRLLVSELSRLGRSLSQVIQIVETLVRRKIRFIAIKEAIEFDGKQDLPTKVMIALFGLFAEVERDPPATQRKIISPSRQRHTLPVFFRTPDCGLSITFVVARQRCKLGGTS